MKKMIVQFQSKFKSQDTKIGELQSQVTKLAHVNLKLNADNKIIRSEHDALKHKVHKLERLVQLQTAGATITEREHSRSQERNLTAVHSMHDGQGRDPASANRQQRLSSV